MSRAALPTCVVTDDLAAVLRSWLAIDDPFHTIAELSRRAGVPERKIYSILHGEWGTTNFGRADELLLACDKTECLYNGEIRSARFGSVRSPRKSRATRQLAV
jgi:hypothetical protein